MPELTGSTPVLVESSEAEIINYLREAERQRRARIAEIRAKMRECEVASHGNQENTRPPITDSRNSSEQEEEPESWFSGFSQLAGDAAAGAGSGCKHAPNHGIFRKKNMKGNPDIYKYLSGDPHGWVKVNKKKLPPSQNIWRPEKGGETAVVDHLGTALLVVGVAMDAYEVYTCVKQDYEEGTKHNTVHSVGGIAGSWAGGWQGAAYGAACGSTVPGVGSIAGGIVGGIAGSSVGEYFGRYVAETLMPAPDRTIGRCVVCCAKFTHFAVFYLHFVEQHPYELHCLYRGVVKRAGVDRANIKDSWITIKAFVSKNEILNLFRMDIILAFNDRMMIAAGWNVEEDRRREEAERRMKEEERRRKDEKKRMEELKREKERMIGEEKKKKRIKEEMKREEERKKKIEEEQRKMKKEEMKRNEEKKKKMELLKTRVVSYSNHLQPLLMSGLFEEARMLGIIFTVLEASFYYFPIKL